MLKYIVKRIVSAIVTLFIASSLLFILLQFMPGKPYEDNKYDAATSLAIKDKYDLDEPFFLRYFSFIGGIAGFEIDIEDGGIESIDYNVVPQFGDSWEGQELPVSETLLKKLPISSRLGIQAILLGTIIGLIFGILAALYKNRWIDHLITILAVIGISVPSFVFAAILMFKGSQGTTFNVIYDKGEVFNSLLLPTIALSVFVIATLTRYMRSELVEVLESDYIALSHAKGVSRNKVIRRHSIRNALIPVITVMGPLTLSILGGSMVIEKIFSIPGMGGELVKAIKANNHPIVLGLTFYYTAMYMIVILLVDISYGIIDPRIRIQGSAE